MKEESAREEREECWSVTDLNEIEIGKINESVNNGQTIWLDDNYGYIVAGANVPLSATEQDLLKKWQIEHVFAGVPTSTLFRESNKDNEVSSDEEEGLLRAGSVYAHIYQESVSFYERYKSRRVIDMSDLGLIIRDMIDVINSDRRFVLRFNDFETVREDYFIAHAIETTMLSLVIGKSLKMVPHRLMYLGISSFLHEIGLLHMPSELLDEKRILNDKEKEMLSKHTVLGYNILKPLGLDREIMLGVLQHHERIDGSGYTEKLFGDDISLFAKIIGVTCSYHAQIFERDFKKAKSGHLSLVDLLSNLDSKYDANIIKILVRELSIFPLGSGVVLSDGSVGIIMDVDPTDPRHPMAQILVHSNGTIADGGDVVRVGGYLTVKNVLNNQELQEIKAKVVMGS